MMRVLYIEPFNGGSHAAFTQTLTSYIEANWTVLALPGRHWKWRMRGAASYLALERAGALEQRYDVLFASSFLPLAELKGLCPQISDIPSVLYFHENQLAYPVRDAHTGERDYHFGFTQLVSALATTRCVFNSRYNLESFLAAGSELLERMPDAVPSGWIQRLRDRSEVLPLPLELPDLDASVFSEEVGEEERRLGPVILWNHRWEHDKNPEAFFAALRQLMEEEVPFRVIICGERYRRAPEVFEAARAWLGERILHWGYADARSDYLELLQKAHIAVSTAHHEFFGVGMLEATHAGARPVVPDRLAYREIFPRKFRYGDDGELVEVLGRLCRGWRDGCERLRCDRRGLTGKYRAEEVVRAYEALLVGVIGVIQ